MTKADSVHSTPPTNTSADTPVLTFHDLEPRICDLDRLTEIALHLDCDVINNSDAREAELVVLMMQIVRRETQQLKSDFYVAYKGED
jgi:hypothetical protein